MRTQAILKGAGNAYLFESLEERKLLATLFVNDDASGTNSGANWANAYTSLQTALALATSGDQIWVAEGVYVPGSDRTDTFNLKPGVRLYGGFAGTESNINQRTSGNTSVLSGSIGVSGVDDNIFHVVTASGNLSNAILDGFNISNGNANGGGNNGRGGGLFVNNANNFTVSNVNFVLNFGTTGAGIAWLGGAGTLTNVNFVNNAASQQGGAIWASAANPTINNSSISLSSAPNGAALFWTNGAAGSISNSTIFANIAGVSGGGITLSGGAPTFSGVTIENNAAGTSGGGVHVVGTTTSMSTTIRNNSAPNGAGVMLSGGANVTFSGGTINGNEATGSGGGVHAAPGTNAVFGSVTITGNSATSNGGGIFTSGIAATLNGTNITNNTAGNGAGIFINGGNGHTVTGATINNNTSIALGGGVRLSSGTLVVTNSAISNNAASNGGGLYISASDSRTFINTTISNNEASTNGGALYISGGTITLGSGSGITASNNTASGAGGTIYMTGGTINIRSSTFSNPMGFRTADAALGGLLAIENGTLNVANSDFLRFRTSSHGGVFYINNSTVRIFNSRFLGNISNGDGGALTIRGNSTSTIAGSVFSGNFSGGDGAGVHTNSGNHTIVNVTASGNLTSDKVAAAVLLGLPVTAEVLAATTAGRGGFLASNGGTVLLTNSIVWANTAVLPKGPPIPPEFIQPLLPKELQVFISGSASVTVRNSIITAGVPTRAIDGGNILDQAPLFSPTLDGFGPDGQPGTADDRFELAAGSPGIDNGNPADHPVDILDVNNSSNTSELLPNDLLGNARVRGIRIDMGAYESGNAGIPDPEPGPPTISNLRAFPSSDEGAASQDLFPIGQGFDLTAIGVRDFDGDLARVDYYFDVNRNGVFEPGIDLLLGSVAYAEDGPGGLGFFDPTIVDEGLGIGFDGIPDVLQGANPNNISSVPTTFILRLTNAQVAAMGAGEVRFYAVAVDAANNTSNPAALTIRLGDEGPLANYSLIIGGGAQRPIAAQVPFATGRLPEVIQLADFDGDGLLDAVVTTEDPLNIVTIYYGNGDGTFTGRYDIIGIPRSEDVVIGDFNGDGRPDFATSNWPVDRPQSGSITVVLNQGGRGAAAFPPSAITTYAARNDRFSIDAADLNGNGHLDLIAANLNNDGQLDIFLNNGTGQFSRINGPATLPGTAVGRVRLADLNNNGNADIIYTQRSGAIVVLYSRNDNPLVTGSTVTVGSSATFAYPQASRSLRGLRFADLNGDGFKDMVVSNQNSNTIAVYINNGSGGFAAGVLYTVGSGPEDIAIGDLNNDGFPDIAVANTSSGNMSLLTNNGDGTFQPAQNITVGQSPEGIAIGDVTNNGANDIVTANIGDNTISFLKNSIGRRSASGTENAAGTAFVGIINQTANPIVFQQASDGSWQARRLNTGSVFLVGQITAVTVGGNQHFFANSTNGLRWFFPKNDGTGTYFDLDLQNIAGIPNNIDFAFSLSHFIDPAGNPHLFGLTSDGEYVTVRRTGVSGGNWIWQYENISQSILNNNPSVDSIPVITEFEPYVTRWNQWGIAGITDGGDVVSLWTAPSFNFWTISNLSNETRNYTGGNVQLAGGLATVITRRFDVPPELQTQWDGINIAGLDSNGHLHVLWWAAANVSSDPNNLDSGWRISNLTNPQTTNPGSSASNLPAFADRGLSSYFTTWGGINYVGFNTQGQIQIYWWVPGFLGQYISSVVTDTLPSGTLIPVADLNSYSAPNGTISIFGPGPQDETLRLWVDPFAPGTSWGVQNLSAIAERIVT